MKNIRIEIIPFIVVVYFFIHFSLDIYYFSTIGLVFQKFFKYTLFTGILFFIGYSIFNNKERYTLIFSSMLFFFLFFGTLRDTAISIKLIKPSILVDFETLLWFLGICFLIILIVVFIRREWVKNLLQFWLIYCFVLIVYDAGVFLISKKSEKRYLGTAQIINSIESNEKPSVFFIVLDMYPSDTSLSKYMKYDNTSLSYFLKQNNFYVTGNAKSLYEETYYSLASTLNLKPLKFMSDPSIKGYKKPLIAFKNIEHSFLIELFEASGYEFRNYSIFNMQGQTSPLKFNLSKYVKNALTSSTFFNRADNSFEPDFFEASRGIRFNLLKKSWSWNVKSDLKFLKSEFYSLMDNMQNSKVPSFNYFHFDMPHPPVLYDSMGKENSLKDMYSFNGYEKTRANFISYLKYVNKEIKSMVQKIFEKYGKNVIIVLQGDHGYRESYSHFPNDMRVGTYNAVYLPNGNYENFEDTIKPIETFKMILFNQFNYTVNFQ